MTLVGMFCVFQLNLVMAKVYFRGYYPRYMAEEVLVAFRYISSCPWFPRGHPDRPIDRSCRGRKCGEDARMPHIRAAADALIFLVTKY